MAGQLVGVRIHQNKLLSVDSIDIIPTANSGIVLRFGFILNSGLRRLGGLYSELQMGLANRTGIAESSIDMNASSSSFLECRYLRLPPTVLHKYSCSRVGHMVDPTPVQ